MRRSFAESLKIGEDAERLVAGLVPGVVVFTGKATRDGMGGGRIYQRDEATICPDLQTFTDGARVVWFEVKWKNEPVMWRHGNVWRHGIDYPLFCAYEKVAHKTGSDVWIVVVEAHGPAGAPGETLAIDIEKARGYGTIGFVNGEHNGMFYWDRHLMVPFGKIEPCGGDVTPAPFGVQGVLL